MITDVSEVLSKGVGGGGWDLGPYPKLWERDAGRLNPMGPLRYFLPVPATEVEGTRASRAALVEYGV